MRQIGSIEDPKQAEQFQAYLITQGIGCSVDSGTNGYVIWIQNEDQLDRAREELARFRAGPNDERYREATRQAAAVLHEKAQQAAAIRSRTIDMRERWRRPSVDQTPVTFGLMALMIVLGLLQWWSPEKYALFADRLKFSTDDTLKQIWSGELWRLLAPVFMHGNQWHLIFNLLALRSLGMLVESRLGSPKFFGMFLILALLSNYAEFAYKGGSFVGMSGVIYGVFGYAWVRGRLDPQSGVALDQTTVTYMFGWFVLCWVLIPGIANGAHTGGLIVGAAMGASAPLLKSLFRR